MILIFFNILFIYNKEQNEYNFSKLENCLKKKIFMEIGNISLLFILFKLYFKSLFLLNQKIVYQNLKNIFSTLVYNFQILREIKLIGLIFC